ncbi:hypothetical protein P8452_23575 [Trifolium repens]|nr:hypothetical protein P8452_23575 [Trifolium repens]
MFGSERGRLYIGIVRDHQRYTDTFHALNKTLKPTKLSRCNNCVELNSTARKNAIELYRRSKEILPQQSMIMLF